MREILFRAKVLKTNPSGENGCVWREGHFYKDNFGTSYIIALDADGGGDIFKKVIIPETVGEYTGLKDKNGKKIFEGDVVKLYNTFLTVTFDAGCFYAGGDSLRTFDNSLEVIGNIHTTPD